MPEPDADRSALTGAMAAVEGLIRDGLGLAGRLRRHDVLPDLEKSRLAAERAAACMAAAGDVADGAFRHEMRNHLGAAAGYVELLQEENAAPDDALRPVLAGIAAALAELLEGVESAAPGGGTNAQATLAALAPAPAAERGNLLVIDDNEQSRELLGRYLGRLGHSVYGAASGAQALEILHSTAVDLVFLDLVMPEMSGLELLQRLKSDARLRAVPVIIVSGIDDTERVIHCIEAGADDYLNKPFNPTLLQARLNAGLERKRWHDREEAYRRELERNQRFIRNTFGRYLSDEIVDALLESPQGLNLGGSRRRVTILMADIRNFSWICEHHAPEQVVALLNNYLGAMSGIIMNHNGTVDEFIGDAILAIFGAPVARPDDARRAVACALAMQRAVAGINARNAAQGLPAIGVGIGINTGEVVAGNIGSERRSKYAVVGHTVNLTARIESYTAGGEVLASLETIGEAGAGIRTGRTFTEQPKGMAAEVTVCAIESMEDDAPARAGPAIA